MSTFKDRLHKIRAQAEERASRLASGDSSSPESPELARFRRLQHQAVDSLAELSEHFADEYEGFESIRVAMETGPVVRVSRMEEVEGARRLSRLTFAVSAEEDVPLLKVTCKSVVFNRERGHEELELVGPDATVDDPLARLKSFAELQLLDFATSYEEARLRPIS